MSLNKMNKPAICAISPIYGSPQSIKELCQRLSLTLKQITDDFKIILVDDCSPDDSWKIINEVVEENDKVKGIRLSRNFGQHYAISAGLKHSAGDWVVVLDCDLQDRPEEIINLYNKAIEGYDVVQARRKERKDGFFKRLFSKLFYQFLGYLSGVKLNHEIANFGIYSARVIKVINQMPEKIKFFPTMLNWVGFNKTSIEVNHSERLEGKSSYNFKKLLQLALDIILANSDKPMRLMLKLGLIVFFTSLLFAFYTLYLSFSGQVEVLGYSSLIISVWLFSGLIIFMLGLTGLYIGKIFEGVKDRPVYIVSEIIESE